MKPGNFYQLCIFICIALVIFTLAVNFVDGLGIFPTTLDTGVNVTGKDTSGVFETFTRSITPITGFSGSMNEVWLIGISLGAAAAIGLAWATGQTTPIGVYLFGAVFWTSYMRALAVLNVGDFIPEGLLIIGTVTMFFVFVGAVAGLLGGG